MIEIEFRGEFRGGGNSACVQCAQLCAQLGRSGDSLAHFILFEIVRRGVVWKWAYSWGFFQSITAAS